MYSKLEVNSVKKFNFLKIPNKGQKYCPKCLNIFNFICSSFEVIFWNFFCPVYYGESRFEKKFEEIENFSSSQKCRKTFPKVFKHVVLRWNFREKNCPVYYGGSGSEKNPEKFSNFQKFPKGSQQCLNMFRGNFFPNFFRPVSSGGSRFEKKIPKKSKNFQNSESAQKHSQMCLNWSMDVAFMEKLANQNSGYRYLRIAVDVLSRFVLVQPTKSKSSTAVKEPTKDPGKFPYKLWTDQDSQFRREFKNFCDDNQIEIYYFHWN